MRYEVTVTMTMLHVLAVDADSISEAQSKAMNLCVNRDADKLDIHTEVEVGNG